MAIRLGFFTQGRSQKSSRRQLRASRSDLAATLEVSAPTEAIAIAGMLAMALAHPPLASMVTMTTSAAGVHGTVALPLTG